jgi:glycosyltransferase involved in cell wall biosynthesis
VDRILRAFAIIQEKLPEARLVVAGDGSQRASLEQLAKELKLRNTEFTGQVDHERIIELYDAADIYLNASEIDNQPLSILEAFACGLPVVSTDAGGIPFVVSDGETGFLVKRGDYEALADRAFRLLEDPELAGRIIARARNECRKYGWEAIREQWLEVYQELASGESRFRKSGTEREVEAMPAEPKIGRS